MFHKYAKGWIYLAGAVTGVFLTTKAARKAAVNTIAGGMLAKDKINEGIANLKDDANDIYEDAKRKRAEMTEAGEAEEK